MTSADTFTDYEAFTAAIESKGYSSLCTSDGITKAGNKKFIIMVKDIDGNEVFKSTAFDFLDKRGILRRKVVMENQLKEVNPKTVAAALKQFEALI